MTDTEDPEKEFEPPVEGEPLYGLWLDGWHPMDHPPINEEVEDHIERTFGKIDTVLHEILSSYVHLDVNVIPPSHGRDFTTYVTSGMSDLPMKVTGIARPDYWSRAELLIALPGAPDQHVNHHLTSSMRNFARYPHREETWLAVGHTIGDPDDGPIAEDTRMCAYLLGPPVVTPLCESSRCCELKLNDGGCVHFFAIYPIHPDELALKLKKGSDSLFDLFARAEVTEVYRPDRPSAVRSKRRLELPRFLRKP